MNEDFISIDISGEPWLVRLKDVREILPMVALQDLSLEGPDCIGMLNLRGEIIPVFELKSSPEGLLPSHFILVTGVAPDSIGIVVHSVADVLTLDSSTLSTQTIREKSLTVARIEHRVIPILEPEKVIRGEPR